MSATINKRSGEALLLLDWLARVSKKTTKTLQSPSLPFDALVLLAHAARSEPPTRLSALAASASLSPVQMSRLIKSLQKARLATLKLDPADGRSRLIVVTSEGFKKLEKLDECVPELISEGWEVNQPARQIKGLRNLRLAKQLLNGETSGDELGTASSTGDTRTRARRSKSLLTRSPGAGTFDFVNEPCPSGDAQSG
jgi:DNA-binding MarR family transcriptional regulator